MQPNDFALTQPDPHAPSGDLGQWNLIRRGRPARLGPVAGHRGRGRHDRLRRATAAHPDIAGRIAGAAAFGTSSPTTDTVGHGTHTAGLACGDADNGFGIAAMGFDCSLFIAKLALPGSCSNVANGITAAANRNSDVISMSFGGCDTGLIPALELCAVTGLDPRCRR